MSIINVDGSHQKLKFSLSEVVELQKRAAFLVRLSLSNTNTNKSSESSSLYTTFLTLHDDDSIHLPTMPSESISITKLHQLQEMVLMNMNMNTKDNDNSSTVIKMLMPVAKAIVYPLKFPIMLSNPQTKQLISTEKLYMSIYSKSSGYNYTSEYFHIYNKDKSKSNKLFTRYTDVMAICKRAILIENSALDNDTLSSFADYIIRMSSWELLIAEEICNLTLNSSFPHIVPPLQLQQLTPQIKFGKIYIGSCDNTSKTLEFWIRVVFDISDVSSKSYPSNPPTTEQINLENTSRRASKVCYYRKYIVTPDTVRQLEAAGGNEEIGRFNYYYNNKLSKPLPPPKQPAASDAMVYLLINQPNPNSTGSTAYSEVQYASSNDVNDNGEKDQVSHVTSPNIELVAWGNDSCQSLGFGLHAATGSELAGSTGKVEQNYEPRAVPWILPRLRVQEGVKQIACSPRHTLILSNMGILYSCGENSEGALGHGDTQSRSYFAPVFWPETESGSRPPIIQRVSAGSASIGSHSMAIDNAGVLYGWGVPYAAGQGTLKPVLTPTTIAFHSHFQTSDSSITWTCTDVSCGAGFTVAAFGTGLLCSWGLWSHGRLGLGATPVIDQHQYGRRSKGAKLARFQLRPKLMSLGLNVMASKVSCGEAHAMCLTTSGEILAWGQNACGQVGVGYTPSGCLRDGKVPVYVRPFYNDKSFISVSDICAGAYHSLAVDSTGRCWSWGARGSACLGHSDALLDSSSGGWSRLVNTIFSPSNSGNGDKDIVVPYELLPWCDAWSKPRLIQALTASTCTAGTGTWALSAGDMHSAFVSPIGHLFLCGTGPVVPPIVPISQWNDLDEEIDRDHADGTIDSVEGAEADLTDSEVDKMKAKMQHLLSNTVSAPRRTSSSWPWLGRYSSRRHVLVAGGGLRCFAVLDEENICHSLTAPLLKQLKHRHTGSTVRTSDDSSLGSTSLSSSLSLGSASPDCVIVTSGRVIPAHRAILAHRSPELRDMILLESGPGSGSELELEPLQILLPELNFEAAKALVHYMYCDVLPASVLTAGPAGAAGTLLALTKAGKSLRMPRLQLLAEQLLTHMLTHMYMPLPTAEELPGSSAGLLDPSVTLVRDLGSLVGDPQFADVRFVAEGRAIFAHAFVLESRCEYFAAMFRSGMMENRTKSRLVDIVVPDTFVAFLRLLLFIYTDTLPDGSDDALLEDLVSADRYQLDDMKVLCESMLVPNKRNWVDLLHVSDLINSEPLKRQVVCFIAENNFPLLLEEQFSGLDKTSEDMDKTSETAISAIEILRDRFPGILEEIMMLRQNTRFGPPAMIYTRTVASNNAVLTANDDSISTLPLWALCLLLLAAYTYSRVASIITLGYLVPVINASVLIAGIIFLGFRLKNS